MSGPRKPTRWLVDSLAKAEVDFARRMPPLIAAFGFGYRRGEPGQFKIDLASLYPHVELWQSHGQLKCGHLGAAAFAGDDQLMLAELALNEDEGGGLIRTTSDAYRRLVDYTAASGYPHVLRTWTYLSALNHGDGDSERYKQFCVGRARGLGQALTPNDPAATVIGRVSSSSPWLQLIWLAAKQPGRAIDNPRQRQPRAYGRKYGVEPPRFSRAMLMHAKHGPVLFISGTAAVVGEQSMHLNDLAGQFAECARNLEAVLDQASYQLAVGSKFGSESQFRVYVRSEERMFEVAGLMQQRFPGAAFCVLAGEISRSELLVEIEAVHHF